MYFFVVVFDSSNKCLKCFENNNFKATMLVRSNVSADERDE